MSPGSPKFVTGSRYPVDGRSSPARYCPVAPAPPGATILVVGLSVNTCPGTVTIDDGCGTTRTGGGASGAAFATGANNATARQDTVRHSTFRIIADRRSRRGPPPGYRRDRYSETRRPADIPFTYRNIDGP